MRRGWRMMGRILALLAMVLAVGLLLHLLLPPRLAASRLHRVLQDAGLPPASFAIRSASLAAADYADLYFGDSKLKVAQLHVTYDLGGLRAGHLQHIEVVGARWQIPLRNGQFDLGPIGAAIEHWQNQNAIAQRPAASKPAGTQPAGTQPADTQPANGATQPQTGPSTTGAAPAEPTSLNFDRLELKACSVVLLWQGHELLAPLSGTMVQDAPGRISVSLHSELLTFPLHVSGRLLEMEEAGERYWQVTLLLRAAGREMRINGRMGGGHDTLSAHLLPQAPGEALALRYRALPAGQKLFTLFARTPQLRLPVPGMDLELEEGRVEAQMNLNEDSGLHSLAVQLGLTRLQLAGQSYTDIAVEAQLREQRVLLTARSSGPGWKLEHLQADLPAAAQAWREGSSSVGLSWRGQMTVPPALIAGLSSGQLDVSRAGALSLAGTGFLQGPLLSPSQWQLQIDQGQLALAPGELTVRGGWASWLPALTELPAKPGAVAAAAALPLAPLVAAPQLLCRGAAGRCQFHGRISGQGLDLTVEQGSVFELGQLQRSGLTIPVAAAAPGQMAVMLTLPQAARLRWQSVPGERWAVAAPQLGLSLGSQALRDLFAVELKPHGLSSVIQIVGDAQELAFSARSEQELTLAAGAVEAQVKTLTLQGRWQPQAPVQPALAATLTLAAPRLRYGDQVNISDLKLHLPWSSAAPATPAGPERGSFSLGAMTLGGADLPGLEGTIQSAGAAARYQFTWPLLPQANLKASGAAAWTTQGFAAQLQGDTGSFTLTSPQSLARYARALADAQFSGRFRLHGQVDYRAGKLTPRIDVQIEDASVQSKSFKLAMQGIRGAVAINSLDPLGTPGDQRIAATSGQLANVPLTSGSAAFSLDGSSIMIERLRWDLPHGGSLRVHAFRYELGQQLVQTELFIEHLSLEHWLGLVTGQRLVGYGFLHGRLPLRVNLSGQTPELAFGQGYLFAEPGQGYVEVEKELVERALGNQDVEVGQANRTAQVKQKIVDSLRDFQYRDLSFRFEPGAGGGLTARIHVDGIGRKGPNPVPVVLDINVHHFDQILSKALLLTGGN